MTDQGRIGVQRDGPVLTLLLDRPDRMNAFGGTMREDLAAALEAAAVGEDRPRVVVIRGAGSAFCAGGDVANLLRLRDHDDHEGLLDLLSRGERVVRAVRALPAPVVAAIDGPAMGAGLTLALACDVRLASPRSRFAMSFVHVGLHPDWGGSWLLTEAVGPAAARELALTGRTVDSEEALRIGLVHEVLPADSFPDAVCTRLLGLASKAPRTLALIKETYVATSARALEEAFTRERAAQLAAFTTADAREAFAAFLEKRVPTLQGR